ncbi:DUF397 domain-containing protein [Luedemannella helvata]|uniref:DUF397 domain-containing protein n=1 Tax=Luedemannella helvata TaxID=349315 RepID=A0ABP4WW83_9ACTN
MQHLYNGMPATELSAARWQKSQRSNPHGNCVEMAALPDGRGVAVRNSKDPEGPALLFTWAEIAAFVHGARDGDFDNLLG